MLSNFPPVDISKVRRALLENAGPWGFAPQNPAHTLILPSPRWISQQLEPMDDPMYSNLACNYPETARTAG
jgi:hypothetical protein